MARLSPFESIQVQLDFCLSLLKNLKDILADNINLINWSFFLTQHKPHLGLPRTWIMSP